MQSVPFFAEKILSFCKISDYSVSCYEKSSASRNVYIKARAAITSFFVKFVLVLMVCVLENILVLVFHEMSLF